MDEKQARKILTTLEKRAGARLRMDPATVLFGPQLSFVQDQSKLKVACCSRRAGKSHGLAFALSSAAMKYEREVVPYITLTRDTAKNIIWPALNSLDKMFKIGMEFKENTGDVVFPNKARIILRGCDDKNQIEKLRGPKYPIAVIDEAQAFPSFLKELIDDVIEPATIDFNGQIYVTGTPNASCRGVFYEMCEGKLKGAWSQHNWTLRENPHLPNVEAWLDDKMKRSGWTSQHPTYLREYCGKWVRDSSGLVYRVDDKLNLVYQVDFEESPNWEFILGIDLGFNDPTAFCVVAFNSRTGQVVAIESEKESGLIPSAVAARVEKYCERYQFTAIVADTGGFGKGYVEEMRIKYGMNIRAAEKSNKTTYIDMLNGDLQSGAATVLAFSNVELWDEMTLLQWHLDKLDRGRFEEDRSRFQNHLCDAFLYAWREARHSWMDVEYNPPAVGTEEWHNLQAELQEKKDIESYLNKNRQKTDWLGLSNANKPSNWF